MKSPDSLDVRDTVRVVIESRIKDALCFDCGYMEIYPITVIFYISIWHALRLEPAEYSARCCLTGLQHTLEFGPVHVLTVIWMVRGTNIDDMLLECVGIFLPQSDSKAETL